MVGPPPVSQSDVLFLSSNRKLTHSQTNSGLQRRTFRYTLTFGERSQSVTSAGKSDALPRLPLCSSAPPPVSCERLRSRSRSRSRLEERPTCRLALATSRWRACGAGRARQGARPRRSSEFGNRGDSDSDKHIHSKQLLRKDRGGTIGTVARTPLAKWLVRRAASERPADLMGAIRRARLPEGVRERVNDECCNERAGGRAGE